MAADSLLNPEQQSSADNGRGNPGTPAEQPTPTAPHSTDEPRAGEASAGDSGTGAGDETGAVEAAAKVADVNLTRTKVVRREIPPPPPPQQVVIGRRAQDALLDGQQLSDADTAALVADAIVKLQEGYSAWRAATDDRGAPAVDDNGKPTHPQVIFARVSSLAHRSRRKHRLGKPVHSALPWSFWLILALFTVLLIIIICAGCGVKRRCYRDLHWTWPSLLFQPDDFTATCTTASAPGTNGSIASYWIHDVIGSHTADTMHAAPTTKANHRNGCRDSSWTGSLGQSSRQKSWRRR